MSSLPGAFDSLFGFVSFVLKSPLGIARQWSREKFAILTLKPRSHVRILIYRTTGLFSDTPVELLIDQKYIVFLFCFVFFFAREVRGSDNKYLHL